MELKTIHNDGLVKIFFEGELDHHAAKKAVGAIEGSIDTYLPRSMVLDFAGLSFMDSSGIAVILKAFRRMNEIEGVVCVENVRKQPLKVLDAAGLGRIVKISLSAKES